MSASISEFGAAQSDEAALRDARTYAATYSVDLSDALERLALQAPVGELQAELESAYPETYAGLWIEHDPFAVYVAFTEGADERVASHVAGSELQSVVRPVLVSHSLKRLRADLVLMIPLAYRTPAEFSLDIPGNGIDVFVTSADRLDEVRKELGLRLPDTAEVHLIAELSKPLADIYGGLPLDQADGPFICTSGFGVMYTGTGDRGVTTAGHCPNSLKYGASSLTFQTESYGGSHDEQWHYAPGFQVRNWVRDSVGTREITAVVYRAYQAVGFYVCKYGRSTGYLCSTIAATDHLPSTNCVPSPNATFIRTADDISSSGDSGGPTYLGNDAYGQINCGADGSYSVYVAPDYIESLGVKILTSP